MPNSTITKRAQALLALAQELALVPGLTWIQANNAIYGLNGPFVRLFPHAEERTTFAASEECRRIDQLIDGLPQPKVRRQPLSALFQPKPAP